MTDGFETEGIGLLVLSILTGLVVLAGCSDGEPVDGWSPGGDAGDVDDTSGDCPGSAPGWFCVSSCATDAGFGAICEDGEWQCPEGTERRSELDCDPTDVCPPASAPECVSSCTSESTESASCYQSQWECPEGTFSREDHCDSCTDGKTFTNLGVVDGYERADDGSPIVRITWDEGTIRGKELGKDYFEMATLGEKSAEVAESVELSASREFAVRFSAIPQGETSFVIVLPDREDYIDCSHPGMKDRYLLHVTLTTEQGTERLESAEFEEEVLLGDH